MSRLRGLLHRNDACCEPVCDSCATGGCSDVPATTVVPGKAAPKAGETIPTPPKEMPKGPAPEKKVQLTPQPIETETPVLDIVPTSGKSPF